MRYLQPPLQERFDLVKRTFEHDGTLPAADIRWLLDAASERLCGATTERDGETVTCTMYAYAHAHPHLWRHSGADLKGRPWSWIATDDERYILRLGG